MKIYSADDLFEFAEEVNSGKNPSANAILMNDIDLESRSVSVYMG